ncbi:MAG: phenylalanine--tRNA ligase subunit alpha [Thermoprotei archaeon]|nr:phenylalanine--tRNA ligase subunit alpha [Thermoprotei archaeon]
MIVYEVVVSESEYKLLELMRDKGFREGSIEDASRVLGVDVSTLASLVMLLKDKGLVDVEERRLKRLVLTEKGLDVLSRGLPEERLLAIISESGGLVDIGRVNDVLGSEASIAIGQAKRRGLIEVSRGYIKLSVGLDKARASLESLKSALESCGRGVYPEFHVLKEFKDRGLVREVEEKVVYLKIPEDPGEMLKRVKVEISKINSEILKKGLWKRFKLRAYNVAAEPPKVYPARLHFLQEFIEMVRDIMKEMGFVEVIGPLVEVELFNFDLLFQAQDHPAREIHDSLWVKAEPVDIEALYGDLVARVARVHEENWGYKWSPKIASRLMLRSQTTAVSSRIISTRPKPPIRIFTLGRVYRHDVVDATHLPEFHQLDGIEGYHGYTFRDLLGTLKEISERLNLHVKFKPAYFPFTEPSVEGYVKLPNGRWLELYGAGLFRPEVLEMAGVNYPVGAWGFGIERLAAAYYGIEDIRILYAGDVRYITEFKARS